VPKLSFGDGGRAQTFRKTVPDDRRGNAETSFVEFRCCSRHDQISTFRRTRSARPQRFAVGMRTCLKCVGPAPRTQLNPRNAIFGRPFVKRFALCHRTVVGLSVCLSVTLVYCGQTVGWIRMSLGTEVGLSPGNIVLDGDPALLPKTGHISPHFSAHVYCGQTMAHLSNC